MIGLEVSLNGRLLCTAGQEDDNVTAYVETMDIRRSDGTRFPSSLHVGGMKDFVNLSWAKVDTLVAGDEIHIRIVETTTADTPVRTPRKDADAEAEQERLTYEWLKRKYDP